MKVILYTPLEKAKAKFQIVDWDKTYDEAVYHFLGTKIYFDKLGREEKVVGIELYEN